MKLKLKIAYIFIFAAMLLSDVNGQSVTITDAINIRSDYGYEILGNIAGKSILYRDQKTKKLITAFDENFEFIYERELPLEKKQSDVHGLTAYDSVFHMVYTYADDSLYTMLRTYDNTSRTLDTIQLFTRPKSMRSKKFKFVTSKDKSKSVLYSYSTKEGMNFYIIDHTNKGLIAFREIPVENKANFDDFKDLSIANSGEVFLLYESKNRRFSRGDHFAFLINLDPFSGEYVEEIIPIRNILTIDLEAQYDELNKVYHCVGLFSEKESLHAEGIFFFKVRGVAQIDPTVVAINRFEKEFLRTLYKEEDKEKLEHHKIKSLRLSRDGSMILITEYDKVFSRRTPFQSGYTTGTRRTGYPTWMDHYVEEILIMSIEPSGKIRWKNLLHKKQFSQDDNAFFSSFFLFTLPSRLLIVFNDDVRSNNIVSEFSISPSGKLNRSSLLSTAHQNLKLRFTGAVQVSNQSFIVPSEKSNELRLVKVTYD